MAAAVAGQVDALGDWIGALPPPALAAPSPIEGWSVADVVAHLTQSLRLLVHSVARPGAEPPMGVATYLAALAPAAPDIDAAARAAGADRIDLLTRFEAVRREATASLMGDLPRAAATARGSLSTAEFFATQAVELVVHADDLASALPDRPPAPSTRAATAVAVRLLADVLADVAPGHSVELRVPPCAAVQCVPGPRHTRGTPPSVVECSPAEWLRVATGRVAFADAVARGSVSASGERADLSPYLPLLS